MSRSSHMLSVFAAPTISAVPASSSSARRDRRRAGREAHRAGRGEQRHDHDPRLDQRDQVDGLRGERRFAVTRPPPTVDARTRAAGRARPVISHARHPQRPQARRAGEVTDGERAPRASSARCRRRARSARRPAPARSARACRSAGHDFARRARLIAAIVVTIATTHAEPAVDHVQVLDARVGPPVAAASCSSACRGTPSRRRGGGPARRAGAGRTPRRTRPRSSVARRAELGAQRVVALRARSRSARAGCGTRCRSASRSSSCRAAGAPVDTNHGSLYLTVIAPSAPCAITRPSRIQASRRSCGRRRNSSTVRAICSRPTVIAASR